MEKKTDNFEDKYIRWFSEINNKDISIAGGKGASLGEMFNAKFPVPPGFIITAQTFGHFMEHHNLKDKILNILENTNIDNTKQLQDNSKKIRDMIIKEDMPKDIQDEILEAYHILSSEKIDEHGVSQDALNILKNSQEPIFVSVRSSATTEDLADASFAGQQDTYLNVKGDVEIIDKIKKCFASLYTARAVYYRKKKGFKEGSALLAVVIQKMIDSEKSGVVFSKNPVNLSDDIVVEAVYGLGEGIVSGKIKPDNYIVSRDLKIKSIKTFDKKIAIVRTGSGQNETVKLSPERSKEQVLTNGEILEIANYALKLEEHYKKPQDIEFAVEGNKMYILQSRPITTLQSEEKTPEITGKVLVEGEAASPGIGIGEVKIIKEMKDLSKIRDGDVLVTEMTNPDMVVSMQKSSAIITDEGGITSHASIVSREMGIPAVVGTGNATQTLKDGMIVTVDGSNGKVYEGEVAETQNAEIKPAVETSKIKLKVIVDLPKFAERASKTGLDSVGLLRLEGIIASSGKHPLEFEKEGKLEEYTELLKDGIEKIAKYFKNIWIRSSDIRSDEYSNLRGAPEKEINPMLGFHGIRFSLKHPGLFNAELEAIKKVAEKYPDKKIGIMFPQIILLDEVKKVKEILNKIKTPNMHIGVMVETPAAVQIIEDICKEGIDFISFGTNDLTQYTLAVDRNNEDVQYLYEESNPAVLSQMKKVIEVCNRYGVETSICGQAGSKKEIVEFLVKSGISSISVNADAAYEISSFIKDLEDSLPKKESKKVFSKNNNYQRKEKRGYKIICDNCGKEDFVPFKPKPGKPIYCKECYKKMKKNKTLPSLPPDTIPPEIKTYEEDKKDLEIEATGVPEIEDVKVKNINENIGSISPLDNLNNLKEVSDELQRESKEVMKETLEEEKEKEDEIKIEVDKMYEVE